MGPPPEAQPRCPDAQMSPEGDKSSPHPTQELAPGLLCSRTVTVSKSLLRVCAVTHRGEWVQAGSHHLTHHRARASLASTPSPPVPMGLAEQHWACVSGLNR